MKRVVQVKLTREQLNLLLNEKVLTINVPADAGQLLISAPLHTYAEKLLLEKDVECAGSSGTVSDLFAEMFKAYKSKK